MTREMVLGLVLDLPPIPHDSAATTYFEAGVLTIGVEYREVNEELAAQHFTAEELAASSTKEVFNDEGISIHVFETSSMDEYLRFDCLDDEPHYHYVLPRTSNMLIPFDISAHGNMLEWTLRTLPSRAQSMIAETGNRDLSSRVELKLIEAATLEAGDLARSIAERRAGATAAQT